MTRFCYNQVHQKSSVPLWQALIFDRGKENNFYHLLIAILTRIGSGSRTSVADQPVEQHRQSHDD